jgi:hypothetical protein
MPVAAFDPIKDHFVANWSGSAIVTYKNKAEDPTWTPVDANNVLQPWIYFEVVGSGSELAGAGGQPGNRLWRDYGMVYAHVFAPVGEGEDEANDIARAVGEIFRAAAFFDGPGGRQIRTLAPSVNGGSAGSDDGKWFRSTMSVEFSYFYRG